MLFGYEKEENPAICDNVDTEGTILNEVREMLVGHHLYEDFKDAELIETESRLVVARGLGGRGNGEKCWSKL